MQPSFWSPTVKLSAHEEQIVERIRRAKWLVFLRHHRHELFGEKFQQELASLYRPGKRGQPPIAPAQLALATIVQAYTGVSDGNATLVKAVQVSWSNRAISCP